MPYITFPFPFGLLVCGFCLLGLPAGAEEADRDKPMRIEADSMRHDEIKLITYFNGQIVANKGTMVLRGERMEVQQDKQGNQVVHIWAAPQQRVFFRQKREGLDEFTEGESDMAIYDSQADAVTLIQRAEVRILRGNELADNVLLRDPTLTAEEILMSESQERMMAVVKPEKLEAFMAVVAKWDVETSVLGEVTDTGRLFLRNIAMCFDATLSPSAERRHSQTV